MSDKCNCCRAKAFVIISSEFSGDLLKVIVECSKCKCRYKRTYEFLCGPAFPINEGNKNE